MELQKIASSSKPHPPVVGKVTHHSIELYWDLEKKAKRQGPQEQWFRFSIEEEDPKLHTYGIIYTGYATKHVVEGLEPRTLYRFRLKVTSPSGEYAYSPVVSVSTTREPISSEHLHRAVNMNDEDLLVHILQGGVKVDVPNKFGFTALMVAAQRGYTRLVKILISHGTDVNLQNGSGKDSLMLACYAGHLDVVKYLRRHGASWDTRDLGGCTALHWATDGGHCNVIKWMIGDGCEVDVMDAGSGWTPLMRVSAVSGNQEVASLLIDAGADVNVKDKDGKTPLMVAVLNNHEELVQLLLDRGADASVKMREMSWLTLPQEKTGYRGLPRTGIFSAGKDQLTDTIHELWKEGMPLLVGLKLGHIMGLTLVNEMCVEIAPARPSGSFTNTQVPLPSVTRPAVTLIEAAPQPRVQTPEPKLTQNGHDVSNSPFVLRVTETAEWLVTAV